ncbi:Na+/H+ antiporter [Actinocorallia longicatena]|uniref:Na+/H+ antiporter n=1 Tax=Actinocorallia longicatena TaxID=111803 RepID=A0ABP6Q3X3_9ACTN
MDQLALIFLLAVGAVAFVPVGKRFGVPAPVLMTLGGIVLALLPFVPNVAIPPDFILPLVLPPLLHAAVQRTSWRQFRDNARPILMLAVALVFVTTAAVAWTAHHIIPGLPVAAAVALGALVAPPDPVAATSVAGTLGLPRRMVSILEGEGLFNDVTAIVIYHVAVVAAMTGEFSWAKAGGDFVLSAVVAVVVGAGLGWLTQRFMNWLGEPTLQTALSLLVPFLSYTLADELHGSGVLAVLATALFLSERGSDPDDVQGRVIGASFWEVIDTLVTGIAFGVIGLELATVLRSLDGDDPWELLRHGLVVTLVVILVRLVWMLPVSWLSRWLHRRSGNEDEDLPTTWQETMVVFWSGMRGVATIALALALPLKFPGRDAILVTAFTVIIITLVVQGFTLPWVVKVLDVRKDAEAETRQEDELRGRARTVARHRLRELMDQIDMPDEAARILYGRFGRWADGSRMDEKQRLALRRTVRKVQDEVNSAARHEILGARSEPGVDPEIADRVLRELDLRGLH